MPKTDKPRDPVARDDHDDELDVAEGSVPFEAALNRARRWGTRLLIAIVAVVVVVALVNVFVSLETQHLWFESVQAGSVFSTMLRARILLFVVVGGLAGLLGLAATLVALRTTPLPALEFDDEEDTGFLRKFLRHHPRLVRRVLVVAALLVPLVRLGSTAAAQWQKYLLWRHATPWGITDPTFGRDLSYYIEIYPLHRMVVTLATSALVYALVLTVLAAVQNGTLRRRGPGRVSRALVAQVSVLGALYLLARAAGFWLDRRALVTSSTNPITGPTYTDLHAVAPGRIVMIVAFVLVAALFLANLALRRARVLVIGVVAAVLVAALAGSAWPALVLKLREQPSAATLELPHIAENQKATLAAFGLDGDKITSSAYDGSGQLIGRDLRAQARKGVQIRTLDPNRLSPTFNVKQQLQAYYGFKQTLDVDRYPLDGDTPTDVAIAVRELKVGNVSLNSWANRHVVYTHGYGVVAAPTDSLDGTADVPQFLDGGEPAGQQIPVDEPRVYFGQSSPNYSIVGQPEGSTTDVEFDHPGSGSEPAAHTTYDGGGGVAVGSTWRRLLWSAQMRDPSILFSKAVNSGSRILTVRDPRTRVSTVAPWLTLDGDVYPAVVDGRIQWIVDGYTTTANYPNSQLTNLKNTTTSTLTAQGASIAQPSRQVNYMRNSVKATVDAYTGAVTLYEWNTEAEPDPLLKVWESVFPGLVKPQSDMSASLLEHIRYPQDLFDVQRSLLTQYHVKGASDFYSGNDFWNVPTDPTVAATQQLNAGGGGSSGSGPALPSAYMSLAPSGFGDATFALSSPLVTLNRQVLAAFLTVNASPGPDYGKFTLLELPGGGSEGSPAQVQNDIESDTVISEALTLQRGGNSKVVLGNLLTIPLGGSMLYVEPVYTQASGGSSFPILRHVIAIYGNGDPAFEPTLDAALQKALASGTAAMDDGAGVSTP